MCHQAHEEQQLHSAAVYEAYRIKRHVLHRLRAVVARTRTHHAAAVEFRSRRLLCSSFWALRWWATRVRSHRARRRAHLQRSAMRFWHRVSFRRASCREALTSMTEQRVAERRRRAWYLWRRLYLHRRRMEELALAADGGTLEDAPEGEQPSQQYRGNEAAPRDAPSSFLGA